MGIIITQHKYTVTFKPAEEGGYIVTVEALPGLITYGETLEEAEAMAKDAIICHLGALQKKGLPIPEDKPPKKFPIVSRVAVAI